MITVASPPLAREQAVVARYATLRIAPGVVYRHDRCVTNFGSLRCSCGAFGLVWSARQERKG